MSFQFVLLLALVFIVIWAIVSYSFVRISRQTRVEKQAKSIQPAFRLADQWIMESQRKIERLVEQAHGPLGTAQSELLELRLEAGRLPQGVKNLNNIREALMNRVKPMPLNKPLAEIAVLYLTQEVCHVEEPGFVYLDAETGLVPVLEVPASKELNDETMKVWLNRLSTKATSGMGGFLYFAKAEHFVACQGRQEWMDALRNHRLVALDFEGLTALLISLKLSRETDRLIQVFQKGVESTAPIIGQSDKMGEALTGLAASTLQVQSILEGAVPTVSKPQEGGRS